MAAVLVGTLGLLWRSPIWVAMIGVAATATIYVYGVANGSDTAELEELHGISGGSVKVDDSRRVRRWKERARRAPILPGTNSFLRLWGRKTPVGEISAFLTCTLMVVALAGAGYGTLAVAYVARSAIGAARHAGASTHGGRQAGRAPVDHGQSHGNPAGRTEPRAIPVPVADAGGPTPSYADLCPTHPDPLAVGHGIGELFRHDGAIEAGCGQPAQNTDQDGQVWVARGVCGNSLRSFGVASAGYDPVLLYGAPARFAASASDDGTLLFVETARPDGGEVTIVTTTAGSYLFLRATPSVDAGRGHAQSCEDVTDVARLFAVLPPPMVELWLAQVRHAGWAWPVVITIAGQRSYAFVDSTSLEVVAIGQCDPGGITCELHGHHATSTSSNAAIVSLVDLSPYFPSSGPPRSAP